MLSSWLSSSVSAAHDDPSVSLEDRWRWGLERAKQQRLKWGFWLSLSIARNLARDALVGTTNLNHWAFSTETLRSHSIDSKDELQDVLFMFRFRPGATDSNGIDQIKVSNRPWTLDLGRRPIIWLGRAEEEQSIPLLLELYSRLYPKPLAADILIAVATHTRTEMIATVAARLEQIALQDHRLSVQKDMIDSLFQLPNDAGLSSIINLAQTHPKSEVRKEAQEYLQESCSPRAQRALHEVGGEW